MVRAGVTFQPKIVIRVRDRCRVIIFGSSKVRVMLDINLGLSDMVKIMCWEHSIKGPVPTNLQRN